MHQLGKVVIKASHLRLRKTSDLGPAAPSPSYCRMLTIYFASAGLGVLTWDTGREASPCTLAALMQTPTLPVGLRDALQGERVGGRPARVYGHPPAIQAGQLSLPQVTDTPMGRTPASSLTRT